MQEALDEARGVIWAAGAEIRHSAQLQHVTVCAHQEADQLLGPSTLVARVNGALRAAWLLNRPSTAFYDDMSGHALELCA